MPKLAELNLCTGCTACACICPKGCITMAADADGFRYPVIDEDSCVGCGLCEKVCPVLADNRPNHEPKAYAACSRDTGMRLESSSGGVFTELARHILAQGGAVFGAIFDKEFRVIHACAEDEAALAQMRGAKYAQSDLDGIFADVKNRLNRGQLVLFSGTPCQVGGLISFLGKSYENLTTVDFVCHSVPSPAAWSEYVKSLGDVRSINLRAKDTGWSRYSYCHRIETANGPRLIPNGESLYMKLFVGGYINRRSCENCNFKGYARRSDLTIGDFWGIWDSYPDMDDNRGTSVVLVQSERGQKLWEAIGAKLTVRAVSLEDASMQNSAMLVRSPAAESRDLALAQIRSGDINGCAALFPVRKSTLFQRIKMLLSRIIGGFVRKFTQIFN